MQVSKENWRENLRILYLGRSFAQIFWFSSRNAREIFHHHARRRECVYYVEKEKRKIILDVRTQIFLITFFFLFFIIIIIIYSIQLFSKSMNIIYLIRYSVCTESDFDTAAC